MRTVREKQEETPPVKRMNSRKNLVGLLNEDLAREYQALFLTSFIPRF